MTTAAPAETIPLPSLFLLGASKAHNSECRSGSGTVGGDGRGGLRGNSVTVVDSGDDDEEEEEEEEEARCAPVYRQIKVTPRTKNGSVSAVDRTAVTPNTKRGGCSWGVHSSTRYHKHARQAANRQTSALSINLHIFTITAARRETAHSQIVRRRPRAGGRAVGDFGSLPGERLADGPSTRYCPPGGEPGASGRAGVRAW